MKSASKRSNTGYKWSTISSIFVSALQLIQIVLLSRFFLDKPELGILAILQVVAGFIRIFADIGLSQVLIFDQKIKAIQLNSLFWINILGSIILAVSLIVLAPLVSLFYEIPDAERLIQFQAGSLFFIALGSFHLSLLRKEMSFKKVSLIEIVSISFGTIVMVAFGIKGYGLLGFVFGQLSNHLLNSILSQFAGSRYFKVSFKFQGIGLKGYFAFAGYQLGERALNYFITQLDVLVIGKLLPQEVLGIYNLARNIAQKPAQIINPIVLKVGFPLLARFQLKVKALTAIYGSILHGTSTINFLVYLGVFLLARPISILIFGPELEHVAIPLSLLCLYFLVRSTNNPVGALIMAVGKVKLSFYWNLMLLLINPLVIYLGSSYGIEGICGALILLQVVLFWFNFLIQVKPIIPLKFGAYLKLFSPSAVPPVAAFFVTYLFMFWFSFHWVAELSIGAILYLGTFLILTLRFNKTFLMNMRKVYLKK